MKTAFSISPVIATLTACGFAAIFSPVVDAQEHSAVRIGTYDSRAIAVAWAASEFNPVSQKMKEFADAKNAGDTEKAAELEAWGRSHQRKLHFQGFGRVPVDELLEPVQKQMTQLLADKQLAAITMNCNAVADGVEIVDITMDIVQLYEPAEQTLKWVRQLKDHEPLSLIELADLPAEK